jgi:phosphoribosylformylglycinamidine synthase
MKMYKIHRKISNVLELIFYIETSEILSPTDLSKLVWLVAETFEPKKTGFKAFLDLPWSVDIGPRLAIETPFSSNALSICKAIGIPQVKRLEKIRRSYPEGALTKETFLDLHLDRMTQQEYPHGVNTFDTGIVPESVRIVDLLGRGIVALEETNSALGLGMDAWDMKYYLDLFVEKLRRNPTDVELLQLGNANSEHSRHWFFKGQMIIDGTPVEKTLLEIVQEPLKSLVGQTATLKGFNDNSGVLKGFEVEMFTPVTPGSSSSFAAAKKTIHITGTAETHNHPTAEEEFSV